MTPKEKAINSREIELEDKTIEMLRNEIKEIKKDDSISFQIPKIQAREKLLKARLNERKAQAEEILKSLQNNEDTDEHWEYGFMKGWLK